VQRANFEAAFRNWLRKAVEIEERREDPMRGAKAPRATAIESDFTNVFELFRKG
jgi:hypothetical protein